MFNFFVVYNVEEYKKKLLLAMTIFSFHIWWMTIAPTWYGLMYALSFLIWLFFIQREFAEKDADTLFFATILWVILGWRFGYVLFYNLGYYLTNPLEIFMPWKGGMSFHGGVIGVIIAWIIAARKIHKPFLVVADKMVWIIPIGLFFGRIGNYINGELLGMAGYSWPFARIIDGIPYFPTPLLESLLEGVLLFVLLLWKKKNIAYPGQVWVWFLAGYGMLRFATEFIRNPDVQIGYLFGTSWLTLGQVFCLVMILVAGVLSLILNKKH